MASPRDVNMSVQAEKVSPRGSKRETQMYRSGLYIVPVSRSAVRFLPASFGQHCGVDVFQRMSDTEELN